MNNTAKILFFSTISLGFWQYGMATELPQEVSQKGPQGLSQQLAASEHTQTIPTPPALVLELPLIDSPFNWSRGYTVPSMQQAYTPPKMYISSATINLHNGLNRDQWPVLYPLSDSTSFHCGYPLAPRGCTKNGIGR